MDEVKWIREVAMRGVGHRPGVDDLSCRRRYWRNLRRWICPPPSRNCWVGFLKVSVSKRAVIEAELARNLPLVNANPARISQLLVNLVTNASEAIGDREGFIRVTTERVAGSAAGRNPSTQGDSVRLEVSDTGPGMPSEIQSRVFEPYFSTKSRGRGLGLAVVDGICSEVLGGVIQLGELLRKREPPFGLLCPAS